MQKVTKKVPHEVRNKKGGGTHTVWQDEVTEGLREKENWDPGAIFVTALNNAGESEETAARFWEMMIQASPFQRFIKALSKKTAGVPRFAGFLLWITRTKPQMKLKHTPRGKNAFSFKKETKKETIARAWNRLVVIAFLLLLLVFALAVIAIPVAAYKLAVGTMVAEGGMGGLVAGMVFWTIILLILSPIGFTALRLAGFTPSRRKYFSVVAFLVVAGIATRVIVQAVSLETHPALAPVVIGALLILVWTNVYKRLSASDEPQATGNGYTKLNGFVTVLFILALVGMVFGEQFPNPTMSWHRAKIDTEEFLGLDENLFTGEGVALQCRPMNPMPSVAVESDWWMEFVSLCDGTNPGINRKTGLGERNLTPSEALRYNKWKEEKRREAETTSRVVRISHKAPLRPGIVNAGTGLASASISIPRGWGARAIYANGPFKLICLPSGEEVELLGGELPAENQCRGRTTGVEFRSLSDEEVTIRLRWFRLR